MQPRVVSFPMGQFLSKRKQSHNISEDKYTLEFNVHLFHMPSHTEPFWERRKGSCAQRRHRAAGTPSTQTLYWPRLMLKREGVEVIQQVGTEECRAFSSAPEQFPVDLTVKEHLVVYIILVFRGGKCSLFNASYLKLYVIVTLRSNSYIKIIQLKNKCCFVVIQSLCKANKQQQQKTQVTILK